MNTNLEKISSLLATSGPQGQLPLANTINNLAQRAVTLFDITDAVIVTLNPISGQPLDAVGATGRVFPTTWITELKYMTSDLTTTDLTTLAAPHVVVPLQALTIPSRRYHKPYAVALLPGQQRLESQTIAAFQEYARLQLQHNWALRRYECLANIGKRINENLRTPRELYEQVKNSIGQVLDVSHFLMVGFLRPSTGKMEIHAVEDGIDIEPFETVLRGLSQKIVEEGKPYLIWQQDIQLAQKLIEPLENTGSWIPSSAIFVPLTFHGQPFGILSLQHRLKGIYDKEDLQCASLLAQHISISLSNIDLFNSLSELNDTGQLVNSGKYKGDLLQTVTEHIRLSSNADLVILYSYNQATEIFDAVRSSGDLRDHSHQPKDAAEDNSITGLTLQLAEPVYAQDATYLYTLIHEKLGVAPTTRGGAFEYREHILSSVALPLRLGQERLGALFINFRESRQLFKHPQRLLIEGLAAYSAIAINYWRRFSQIQSERRDELVLLQQMDITLGQMEFRETLEKVLTIAMERITAIDECSVLLYNRTTQKIWVAVAGGTNKKAREAVTIEQHQTANSRPLFDGTAGEDYRYIPDTHKRPDDFYRVNPRIRSELDAAIVDPRKQIVGVLNLESYTPNAFAEHIDFVRTLAGQAALAIVLNKLSRQIWGIREILTHKNDLRKVFNLALELSMELTGAQRGTLLTFEQTSENDGVLVRRAARGERDELDVPPLHLTQGIVGYVASRALRDDNPAPLNIKNVSEGDWPRYYHNAFSNTRSELVVPMLENNKKLYGILNLESREPGNFTQTDEDTLAAFAPVVMVAMQNAESFLSLEEAKEQLQALRDIDKSIIEQKESFDATLATVLDRSIKLFQADKGDLYLYDYARNQTRIYNQIRPHGEAGFVTKVPEVIHHGKQEHPRTPIRQGVIDWVGTNGKPYLVANTDNPPPFYKLTSDLPIRCELAVPLRDNNYEHEQTIGVLNLESYHRYHFSLEHIEMLQAFAGQAVIAIQNAQKARDERRETDRRHLLIELAKDMAQAISEEEVHIGILNRLVEYNETEMKREAGAGFSKIVLRVLNETTGILQVHQLMTDEPERFKINTDYLPEDFPIGKSVTGYVAANRKSEIIDDKSWPSNPVKIEAKDPNIQSILAVPLQVSPEPEKPLYGVLTLSSSKPFGFDRHDQDTLTGIALQAALSITRIREEERRQEWEKRTREHTALLSIGNSAYDIAHRLINDLGTIPSRVNFMRTALGPSAQLPEVNEDLSSIKTNVERTLRLTKKLKEVMASIETGSELQPIEITMGELLRELLTDDLKELSQLYPAIVFDDAEIDSSLVVSVRPDLARSAFYNVVVNAYDELSKLEQGGRIRLVTKEQPHVINLRIEDNGPGVPPEIQGKIFRLLFSTKNEDMDKSSNTGFGLWSARTNMLSFNGNLYLDENFADGAAFVAEMPRPSSNGYSRN